MEKSSLFVGSSNPVDQEASATKTDQVQPARVLIFLGYTFFRFAPSLL